MRLRAQALDRGIHARRHARRAEHRRAAGAEDAGLLRADLLQRLAQPVAMIEADRADHRHIRIDEIGGVEAAAEPHLEQRELDAAAPRRACSAASVLYSKKVSVVAPRAASMRSKARDERRIRPPRTPSMRMRSL